MERAEPYTVDKSTWGPGPWQSEPDKLQWKDEATGLACLIVRSDVSGSLCGYVGVPSTHPAYGLSYDGQPHAEFEAYLAASRDHMRSAVGKSHEEFGEAISGLPERPAVVPGAGEKVSELTAHGGLTYANGCGGVICHVPEPGQPDNVWWFGFDCAHIMDLSPGMVARMRQLKIPNFMESIPEALKSAANEMREVYRDVPYVQAECADLAKQLAAIQ